jgi:hypothetical protein
MSDVRDDVAYPGKLPPRAGQALSPTTGQRQRQDGVLKPRQRGNHSLCNFACPDVLPANTEQVLAPWRLPGSFIKTPSQD